MSVGRKTVIDRRSILFSTLLVMAGAAKAQDDLGPTQDVVPILVEGDRVYAPMSSPLGSLGLFILDTGADDCLIDAAVRREAGARIEGEALLRGAGRDDFPVDETGPVTLLVGRTPVRVPIAHVGPIDALLTPYSGRHVGGLIGAPFFREHVVTVDFARQRLELRDPKTFAYRGDGVHLPFRFANGAPIVEGAITLADGSRLPLRLLVDLGAQANLLIAQPFAAAHPGLARLSPSIIEPLGAGVGGETRFRFARLPRLDVGPLSARDLVTGLSVSGSLRGGYFDALLGAGFLRRYRVTFDYSRREIILEPNGPVAPDRFDRSGAFVTQDLKDPHRFTIHAIAPGSPAAEAGLSPGDRLLSLAGRPADDDSLSQVRAALAADDGQPVAIVIQRGGRPVETVLHLRALL
jgi:hypothetical protein